MKALLLLLILAPCIAFGQTTAIPDAAFEQALIDLGYDTGTPDGIVPTANIDTVIYLDVNSTSISDLTGIEDFAALTYLDCYTNQLTSLDVSANTALIALWCDDIQLTSLDVSNNTALISLHCSDNQLTSLDVSNNTNLGVLLCEGNQLTSLDLSANTALEVLICFENQLASLDVSNNPALFLLWCEDNQLTRLDVSNNPALEDLDCYANQLICLNVKNGNNTNMFFDASNNPNLTCIEVDNAAWSTANWINIDPQASFSENCNNNCSSTSGINELTTTPKQLLKIVDLMGRETPFKPNTPLIYIYDDGSTERVFKIE